MISSVIWVVGEIGLLVTSVGLVARDRWRLSFFFAAYVPVVLTCTALMKWWPERFWVAEFWIAKETIYRVLMLGMALELAWRTFRAFPGARSASLKTALMILTTTAFAIFAVPTVVSGSDAFETALGQLHPRLINGTIWLMAAILALAQWYRVPVHPFHAALLTSSAAYLALLNTVLSLIGLYGYRAVRPYANALDPPAYLLLTCWWVYIAWRPESETAKAHMETLRKLQLRASSCG